MGADIVVDPAETTPWESWRGACSYLQFVLGYTQEEFAATLRHIAEGSIQAAPLITGHVGVGGVAQAFDELGSPERHANILVHPAR